MFCKTCGQPVSDDAMFCKYCGDDLSGQWQEYWQEHKNPDTVASVISATPEREVVTNVATEAKTSPKHTSTSNESLSSEANAKITTNKAKPQKQKHKKNTVQDKPTASPTAVAIKPTQPTTKTSIPPKRAVRLKKSGFSNEIITRLQPHRKALKVISITLIALALIIALTFASLKIFNNPTARLQRALQNHDTPEVVRLYQNTWQHNPDSSEAKQIETYLLAEIDLIVNKAIEAKLTPAEARESLTAISETKLETVDAKIATARQTLTKLEVSQTTFAAGKEAFDKGDYIKAEELFRQIREDEPLYDVAQLQIKEIQEKQVASIMSNVDELIKAGKHLDAIAKLQLEEQNFPKNKLLQDKLKQTQDAWREKQVTDLLNAANKQIEAKEFGEALKTLATDIGGTDERLTKALEDTKLKYAEYALSASAELVKNNKFDEAIELLNKALGVLPEHADLTAKIKEIEAAKPTLLNELKAQNSSNFKVVTSEISANSGETYVLGNCFALSAGFFPFDIGDVRFKLDQKFTELTGYIDVLKSDSKGASSLQIFGDNKLLYTSPKLEADGSAQSILLKLDVTGVKQLRLITSQSSAPFGGSFDVLIAGWKLFKR